MSSVKKLSKEVEQGLREALPHLRKTIVRKLPLASGYLEYVSFRGNPAAEGDCSVAVSLIGGCATYEKISKLGSLLPSSLSDWRSLDTAGMSLMGRFLHFRHGAETATFHGNRTVKNGQNRLFIFF